MRFFVQIRQALIALQLIMKNNGCSCVFSWLFDVPYMFFSNMFLLLSQLNVFDGMGTLDIPVCAVGRGGAKV